MAAFRGKRDIPSPKVIAHRPRSSDVDRDHSFNPLTIPLTQKFVGHLAARGCHHHLRIQGCGAEQALPTRMLANREAPGPRGAACPDQQLRHRGNLPCHKAGFVAIFWTSAASPNQGCEVVLGMNQGLWQVRGWDGSIQRPVMDCEPVILIGNSVPGSICNNVSP